MSPITLRSGSSYTIEEVFGRPECLVFAIKFAIKKKIPRQVVKPTPFKVFEQAPGAAF